MTVLQTFSFDDPRDLNPYGRLLVGGLPPSVRALPYRWIPALIGRYDVLHVHWPEYLYRAPSRAKQPVKTVLCALLLLRLRLTRTALVRTMHNARPHETGSRLERAFLRALDARTDFVIVMNRATDPGPHPSAVVPHGHYRKPGSDPERRAPAPFQLLLFGLLRPYKGIEELIDAFRGLGAERDYRLVIAGSTPDAEYAASLRSAVAGDPRIELRLGRVDDAELPELVTGSQVVVLPYRNLLNSGAALHALSLNRPVLLRDSPAAAELRDEFGSDAVHLFSGELSAARLREVLEATRALPWEDFVVDMSRREWSVVGEGTARAYAAAIAKRRAS